MKRTRRYPPPPEPMLGLLYSLPKNGWTAAERARFLDIFSTVLDYCIPVTDAAAATRAEAGE